jgi:hypothetical protein
MGRARNLSNLKPSASGLIEQNDLAPGVAGNGPAFSAYASTQTSLAATSFTKVLFATEEFDTNGNFASSRFTPTVAGYYQINAAVQIVGTITYAMAALYKNGTAYKYSDQEQTQNDPIKSISALVYLNGSTDFVEIFAFNGTLSTTNTVATSSVTWFDGHLARAA